MNYINIDNQWELREGFSDSLGSVSGTPYELVDLPNDHMISQRTSPDAPARHDSGYFNKDMCNYTKYIEIPKEWENEKIGLKFDGAMMHATVSVNGSKVFEHHYGYTPFYVDITDYVSFAEKNRITINTNAGLQPSSRWYTGCGIIRSLYLCHANRLHIKDDGIFVYTKEISEGYAFLESLVELQNETLENRIAEVTLKLVDEETNRVAASVSGRIQVNATSEETARMAFSVENPKLWDVDTPNLYKVEVEVKDLGIFKTHLIEEKEPKTDSDSKLFGIRTISVDALRGLRINQKTVKLKGGCLHHDNGLLGAISLYDSEDRKIKKLKELGFNAIRTAHNPPSLVLLQACDRNGMFVLDEAFDSWETEKRPGDFSNYFSKYWEEELTAFIKRDRIHPSVILWSTGNEIPERGGLCNGYSTATGLSEKIRGLDCSRPITNGICSFWSGLDDKLAKEQNSAQNAQNNEEILSWDNLTAPFTNGLDVVGYNYMEDLYEASHKRFPHRVILGSENFPKEIGFRWPLVESLPYVIGDFTWTAWDYIGEAGIGKSLFVDPDDKLAKCPPWEIMPEQTSPYPWRLANDADFDITGKLCPQGAYRSVVWGSPKTHLYSYHPGTKGKREMMSMWGFPDVQKSWTFKGYENQDVDLLIFSNAQEVALLLNGKEVQRKPVDHQKPLPNSIRFTLPYTPGTLEAISYTNNKEISRDTLKTAKEPKKILLTQETKTTQTTNSLTYINITLLDEDNTPIPDATLPLTVTLEGGATLAAFGTGNPKTEALYQTTQAETYQGSAQLILRHKPNQPGTKATLTVTASELNLSTTCEIKITN